METLFPEPSIFYTIAVVAAAALVPAILALLAYSALWLFRRYSKKFSGVIPKFGSDSADPSGKPGASAPNEAPVAKTRSESDRRTEPKAPAPAAKKRPESDLSYVRRTEPKAPSPTSNKK